MEEHTAEHLMMALYGLMKIVHNDGKQLLNTSTIGPVCSHILVIVSAQIRVGFS